MRDIEAELSAVVAEAIGQQLDPAPGGNDTDDERVQRATAHQLVRAALADGQFGVVGVSGLHAFAGGNTAMLVARLDTTLTFVVKVDRSPALVAEAHHLRHAATDPHLPEVTRRAFPRIYAVDDVGPIYGYLMENLEQYSTLASILVSADPSLASQVLRLAWQEVLSPAYLGTRQRRIVPNVVEDYFVRAEERLERAAGLGLIPANDAPVRLTVGDRVLELATGWGPVLEEAKLRLASIAPPFSTFVHGDPNPENILWGRAEDGDVSIRLIDPKDWGRGDYVFDAAKIGHYLRITSPVEQDPPVVTVTLGTGADVAHEPVDAGPNGELEAALLGWVSDTANDPLFADDPLWRERYELAVAANLLGIVGPRLANAAAQADESDFSLGWVAFAEGLRGLVAAAPAARTSLR